MCVSSISSPLLFFFLLGVALCSLALGWLYIYIERVWVYECVSNYYPTSTRCGAVLACAGGGCMYIYIECVCVCACV